MSTIVRKDTLVWNVLMKQVKLETEELWKFETNKAKMKLKHSKEKQKVTKSNDESIIDGVAIGDDELEKFRKNEENDTDVRLMQVLP